MQVPVIQFQLSSSSYPVLEMQDIPIIEPRPTRQVRLEILPQLTSLHHDINYPLSDKDFMFWLKRADVGSLSKFEIRELYLCWLNYTNEIAFIPKAQMALKNNNILEVFGVPSNRKIIVENWIYNSKNTFLPKYKFDLDEKVAYYRQYKK